MERISYYATLAIFGTGIFLCLVCLAVLVLDILYNCPKETYITTEASFGLRIP